jgi:hypothetical protein
MKNERFNTTQPSDWEAAAEAEGVSLAEVLVSNDGEIVGA